MINDRRFKSDCQLLKWLFGPENFGGSFEKEMSHSGGVTSLRTFVAVPQSHTQIKPTSNLLYMETGLGLNADSSNLRG